MQKLSFFRLLALSSVGFALTFSSNVQEPALMTHKVLQLAPDSPNTALGYVGFAGLVVAMLVQPIVGVFSDRARTRLGRRLPFMIGGAALVALSIYTIAFAPSMAWLLFGVLFIQFSSNIVQGPFQALIPDLVDTHQRGQASSVKAIVDIVAVIVGGAFAGQLMGHYPEWGEAAVFATASAVVLVYIIALIITLIWGREKEGMTYPEHTRTVSEALRNTFSVDFHAHPAFGWWFANRLLFWAGMTFINTFLLTYTIDVLGMAQAEAQVFRGNLTVILGLGIVLVVLPSGWLSDRIGRKPLVMTAGVTAFLGTLLLLFVRDLTLITICAAVVGMSVGIFLSANWALVTDIVPGEEAARYLGIANIATAGGSALARLIGGTLIDPINAALNSSMMGYLIVYGIAALFFLVSALVIIPLPKKV